MADVIFPGETPEAEIGLDQLPNNVNLKWWKGDKMEFYLSFKDDAGNPLPIDDLFPEAVMKPNFTSATQYTFITDIVEPHKIRVYLPSAVSKTIPAGDYIWNFQFTDDLGDTTTRLAGDVVVLAEVDS